MKKLLWYAFLLFFLFFTASNAAEVTLQWIALDDPGLTGYKIYYTDDQTIPDQWSELISKSVTEHAVNNLMPGDTYWFYMNTLCVLPMEGESSNIVEYTVPVFIHTDNPKPTLVIIQGSPVIIEVK